VRREVIAREAKWADPDLGGKINDRKWVEDRAA